MAKYPKNVSSEESGGFSEEGTGPLLAGDSHPKIWRLKVAPNGRLVIPAALRAAMRLGDGGMVSATVEDGVVKLVTPAVAIAKLQQLVRERAGDRSLADELIAERRAEAERE